jgi:hypothetical protein
VEKNQDVDTAQLRQLYNASPINNAVFDWLASRERPRSETKIDRIEAILDARGIDYNRVALIQLLRDLETTGCGEFVAGRRGRQTRFLWTHNLISVGRTASGIEESPTPLVPRAKHRPAVKELNDEIGHVFNLRSDFKVYVSLPQNLTKEESERLAAFVRTLPFEA